MYLVLCKQERKHTPFFVNPVLNLFIDSINYDITEINIFCEDYFYYDSK